MPGYGDTDVSAGEPMVFGAGHHQLHTGGQEVGRTDGGVGGGWGKGEQRRYGGGGEAGSSGVGVEQDRE